MSHYRMLSYPMSPDAPRPPAIPAPEVSTFMTIAKDDANVQHVSYYNHTGTHLDTAAHVFEDGISMERFALEEFIFHDVAAIDLRLPDCHPIQPADLIPFEEKIKHCDMLIVRFDIGKIRRDDPARFSNKMPGFTVEAARWLREHLLHLRCLGTDLPSFAVIADLDRTMQAHNVFLQGNDRKMLIIEEMALDDMPEAIQEIIISPWLVQGVNSGPCNILARI